MFGRTREASATTTSLESKACPKCGTKLTIPFPGNETEKRDCDACHKCGWPEPMFYLPRGFKEE